MILPSAWLLMQAPRSEGPGGAPVDHSRATTEQMTRCIPAYVRVAHERAGASPARQERPFGGEPGGSPSAVVPAPASSLLRNRGNGRYAEGEPAHERWRDRLPAVPLAPCR